MAFATNSQIRTIRSLIDRYGDPVYLAIEKQDGKGIIRIRWNTRGGATKELFIDPNGQRLAFVSLSPGCIQRVLPTDPEAA